MYKKAISILFVAFALVVGACSHTSQSESLPTSQSESLPTVTLPDTEWERVTAERDRELEELGDSGSVLNLDFVPNYGFAPNTPEWNTAVVREAEEHKDQIVLFNECRFADLYFGFEKFSVGIIEKMTEIDLRYDNELDSILGWHFIANINLWTNSPFNNFYISNLPEDLSQTELESIENFGEFYEEVRAELADTIGNTSMRSIIENFAYTTIPLLKADFAGIGIESGKLEPSKFQDMWEANPELEKYAKDYLEFIENTEIQLVEFLEENDDLNFDFLSMPIYDSISRPAGEELDNVVADLIFSARDTLEESFSKQPPARCSRE